MSDLAVFYEHPAWFEPLFRALERRGVGWSPISIQDHLFDPAQRTAPAPVVFNRLAMSSFLRQDEHAIAYSRSVLAHWAMCGARVLNGAATLAIDSDKARQLSLLNALGLPTPATRIVHRRADIVRAAASLRFPVMVKANVGGSGAGMIRYEDAEELAAAVADGTTPTSIDGVLLVQEYVPARDGRVIRCETLGGRFLYAIALNGAGSTFDLCPADVCQVEREGVDKPTITIEAHELDPRLHPLIEQIAANAHLDVGGIEYMIDDRDGLPNFYDINALSNFVAEPERVLGFDPHDNLVDWLVGQIGQTRGLAA